MFGFNFVPGSNFNDSYAHTISNIFLWRYTTGTSRSHIEHSPVPGVQIVERGGKWGAS